MGVLPSGRCDLTNGPAGNCTEGHKAHDRVKLLTAGTTGSITACCAVRCPAKRIWMAAKPSIRIPDLANATDFYGILIGLGQWPAWLDGRAAPGSVAPSFGTKYDRTLR